MNYFKIAILVVSFVCVNFTSYGQRKKGHSEDVQPFELIIYDSDYSNAYALQYVLTETNLKIIYKGGLIGEKDTVLFETTLNDNKTLQKISAINIDSLKQTYTNPCVRDGTQISIKFTKANKSKVVHISNYYLPDIGSAIALVNTLVSDKYKIWYDKEELLTWQRRCDISADE